MGDQLLDRSCWREAVGEKLLGRVRAKLMLGSCWGEVVGEKLLGRRAHAAAALARFRVARRLNQNQTCGTF